MELKKEFIGQGNTAEIYLLDDNKILKLFRNRIPKEAVEREYQNSLTIQDILDCIPKVYEMVETDNRYGIIYQQIKGTDLLEIMLKSIWNIKKYAKKLAHYHLSIQRSVMDNLCTVKEKLEEDLNRVDVLPYENKEIVRKYLQQLPEGNELCHFDFHPGNILITDNNAVIIDWMTACIGDACADIARTSLLLKYGESPHITGIRRMLISVFQRHIYKIYIKEYLKISKRKMEDIHQWELPIAAARLHEWISENEKKVLLRLVNEQCNKLS